MTDGRITRILQVTPKLTLPAPVKRLVNDGLIYQEVGKFNPDVHAFESHTDCAFVPKTTHHRITNALHGEPEWRLQ